MNEIMEEDGVDWEEANSIYHEEMEGWIDYSAVEYSDSEFERIKSLYGITPYGGGKQK